MTEATQIAPRWVGRYNVPGLWSQAQVAAWKDIVNAVHARGCFIWCQLWVQGRAATPEIVRRGGYKFQSASAVPLNADAETPEEMTEEDIQTVIQDYVKAAANAVAAGFDGVEVHGGNGYLPDQFLQDTCNKRTDKWGGSIENRARFQIELLKAISAEVGPSRTAIRLSPWSDFLSMGMEDPVPQFTYLVEQLKPLGLAWLDLIEARIRGNDDADCGAGQDVSFLVRAWGNVSPVLLSGGFTPESARRAVDETWKGYDVAIIFGRYWTSNPDLVFRVKEGVALEKYNRATFYTPKLAEGYTDWAFSDEFKSKTVKAT